MRVDDLLDDIEESISFPVTGAELRERFGETEVEHEATDADVPIESETRTFAAHLDRAEADLAQDEDRQYESAEEIRDSIVPPEVW